MLTRTSLVLLLAAVFFSNTCSFNGSPRDHLTSPQEIGGYTCTGWVHYFENGTLKQFETAEPLIVAAGTIPANSTMFLDRDGRVEAAWLADSTQLGDIPCRGGIGKIETRFHDNGNLASAFLSRDTVIQRLPCKAGLFAPVTFYGDGTLKSCRLAEGATVGAVTYEKGDVVHLNPDATPTGQVRD
jgi:hypothetical protein